jgi:putative membrane protein
VAVQRGTTLARTIMPRNAMSFLKRWLITTVAVWVAVCIVPGINCYTKTALLLASLLLGLLNAFVRPVMMLLSLPLLIFTLGLFMLVINALLLWSVDLVLKDFHVDGFRPAFLGSLVISIVSFVLNSLFKSSSSRLDFHTGKPPPHPPPDDPDGGGPIIDI